MKKASLALGLLATLGVWVADLLLLGVPAFRNGWATLALFLVPLAFLVLGRGAEKAPKLAGAAWIIFVLGTGGWVSMRLFTGAIEGQPAVGVGDRAPNFSLQDPDGKNVSLSDFDDRRVLLVFFRGPGCPICRAELRGIVSRFDDLQASRVQVLAVGPQTPAEAKALGLPFPVLSDPGLTATTSYGLVHAKGWFGSDVPRPTTLLVNKGDRKILWMRAATNVRVRPTPEDLFDALRQ